MFRGIRIPLTYKKFISNSTILLVFTTSANALNYLFHVISARYLGVDDYGVLQTVLNILNYFTIVTVILRLEYTKVLGEYVRAREIKKAGAILLRANKKILSFGLVFVLFLSFVTLVSRYEFGQIRSWHIVVSLVAGLFTILNATNRAMMRANLTFFALSFNYNFLSLSKIGLAGLLLFFGFGLRGVLIGIVASFFLTYLFSITQVKKYFSSFEATINLEIFTRNSLAVILGFLGLTSLVSTDLILIQKFIPDEAGLYAGLMIFGKIILFATTPIITVLFPTLIKSKNLVEKKRVLFISFFLVVTISAGILGLYSMFPNRLILLTISNSYLSIAPMLPVYSLMVFLHSISNAIVNASIALDEYLPTYFAFIAAMVHVLLIWNYHKSLNQILIINLGVMLCLSIGMGILVIKKIKFNAK